MEYYESPNAVEGSKPWVFMGGGITGCKNWQGKLRQKLSRFKQGTLVNPRRKKAPRSKSAIAAQIVWERQHLHRCNVVSIWFSKDNIQPICWFELGTLLTRFLYRDPALRVLCLGVDPKYERKDEVNIQVDLALETVGSHARKRFFKCDSLGCHAEHIKQAVVMAAKMNASTIIGEGRRRA